MKTTLATNVDGNLLNLLFLLDVADFAGAGLIVNWLNVRFYHICFS